MTKRYKSMVAQVLQEAEDLFRTSKEVCRRTDARTADGMPCIPTDPRATCWGVTAALFRAAIEYESDVLVTAIQAVGRAAGISGRYLAIIEALHNWGDDPERTPEDVATLLKRAREVFQNG